MIVLTLLDKILRLFGSNEQQVRWRLLRWRRQRETRRQWRANRNQHLTYRHKTCDVCGRVVDRDAKVCPYCDAPVASWGVKLGEKVAERLTPRTGSLTSALLLVNGAIFLYLVVLTGKIWSMPTEVAIDYGANYGPLLNAGDQWWRLFTANFLHVGGALHIGFNLIALATIGPMVEEWYGASRTVLIYLLTGAISMLTSHLWSPLAVSGGASGAVLGLIGAGVIAGHLDGGAGGRAMRNSLLKWFVYVVVFGLIVPGIDNAAHLGGFASGVVLGLGLRRERAPGAARTWVLRGLAVLLSGACLWSFVEAYRYGHSLPTHIGETELRAGWLDCRSAMDGTDAEAAGRACERYAELYAFERPLPTHLAAELLRRAGHPDEADRVLAVLCATHGLADAGKPGPGFVSLARHILDEAWDTGDVADSPNRLLD